jgi:hypothetical protein
LWHESDPRSGPTVVHAETIANQDGVIHQAGLGQRQPHVGTETRMDAVGPCFRHARITLEFLDKHTEPWRRSEIGKKAAAARWAKKPKGE